MIRAQTGGYTYWQHFSGLLRYTDLLRNSTFLFLITDVLTATDPEPAALFKRVISPSDRTDLSLNQNSGTNACSIKFLLTRSRLASNSWGVRRRTPEEFDAKRERVNWNLPYIVQTSSGLSMKSRFQKVSWKKTSVEPKMLGIFVQSLKQSQSWNNLLCGISHLSHLQDVQIRYVAKSDILQMWKMRCQRWKMRW